MMWYSLKNAEGPEFRKEIEKHAKGIWDILKANNIPFKAHWGKVNFTSREDIDKMYNFQAFQPHIQNQFVNKYINGKFN